MVKSKRELFKASSEPRNLGVAPPSPSEQDTPVINNRSKALKSIPEDSIKDFSPSSLYQSPQMKIDDLEKEQGVEIDLHGSAMTATTRPVTTDVPSTTNEGTDDDDGDSTPFSERIADFLVRGSPVLSSPVSVPTSRGFFHRNRPSFPLAPSTPTLRLSIISVTDSIADDLSVATTSASSRPHSFGPKDLLDVEAGRAVVVARRSRVDTDGQLVTARRRNIPHAHKEDAIFFEEQHNVLRGTLQPRSMRDFCVNNEVGLVGRSWRTVLKHLLVWTHDSVNAKRLSRILQLFLPYQTAFEAYITSQVIETLDKGNRDDLQYVLSLAFSNRNVSRLLVQNARVRHDFVWHWSTAITKNRLFDALGQLPLIGFTAFPATENFPSTRDHALASIFRVVLGEGNWLTRVVTQGREGLVTDNPKAVAQNLAAEANNFELANRNQYGTHFGRIKTRQFRVAHRLPVDESIIRTFFSTPMRTTTNNGVVHMLRCLANHWHDILTQEFGNFAHQRMEQLDPFDTLRFHMPELLVLLSSLRGRNNWDNQVLGPMIHRLQNLKPGLDSSEAKKLIESLQEDIVLPVCAGIASIVDPMRRWLNAMSMACDLIDQQGQKVFEIVTGVEIGIRLGYNIMSRVNWEVPSDSVLKHAIRQHILGRECGEVSRSHIRRALDLTTPRDKRTLIELVEQNMGRSRPARLLLNRVKTLLQRELRRAVLDQVIRAMSQGEYHSSDFVEEDWYWLEEGTKCQVHVFLGLDVNKPHKGRFLHVDTGSERSITLTQIKARTYNPVAESITRAQRAFMTIELEYGKKFSYNAFMELTYLRVSLERLLVISQMACEDLDNARLNVLQEIKRTNNMQVSVDDLEIGKTYWMHDPNTGDFRSFVCKKKYGPQDMGWNTMQSNRIVKVLPQNCVVVGGGPTGLLTVIHGTESCLSSGGVMKLYEARDAFSKGGSTFERAQIVRLDARWISFLRYYLGTAFEDHYISLSGETDSQLGNTLPTQGFVEITIKDLENMLHVEVSRLWSRGLVTVFTDSKAYYDVDTNSLIKYGENLKVGDVVKRKVDPAGRACREVHNWRVAELTYTKPLGIDELRVGVDYGVYMSVDQVVRPFRLVGVDLDSKIYTFRSLYEGGQNLKVHSRSLPSVYPAGTDKQAHANVHDVVFEYGVRQQAVVGDQRRVRLPMAMIKNEKFTLDVGRTHVIEAIGKPHGSKAHFLFTTTEPYGVLCLQGLKVSMGMHNFGEQRWGSGFLDDLRSINDQNTRIVGDFTKMVRVSPIIREMVRAMVNDRNWQANFEHVIAHSGFPELSEFDPVIPKLVQACLDLEKVSDSFKRQSLQTRFFETGDNFYLGMEFNREFDAWKKDTVRLVCAVVDMKETSARKTQQSLDLQQSLSHHLDRLLYSSALAVLKRGDVYNAGARHRVPDFMLINSYFDETLGSLPIGEGFRVSKDSREMFEILAKTRSSVVVRNVEGYVFHMNGRTQVKRESNLTRGPDGNEESKVAIATFPVAHYVNYRTMRVSDVGEGYVFAFAGDSQSTPHFMRYSGLTGAAINAMSFNNFIRAAVSGIPFVDRFQEFARETNWSNSEVVRRGTGANYGDDGFLRPGFSYEAGIDYLFSKAVEHCETKQDPHELLSKDWKIKFAASLIPRGMELNSDFIESLTLLLHRTIVDKVVSDVSTKIGLRGDAHRRQICGQLMEIAPNECSWEEALRPWKKDYPSQAEGIDVLAKVGNLLSRTCSQIIELARELHFYDDRISSQALKQPKSVDSIVDDFAVEAQNFANALTLSAAYSAGALAFRVIHAPTANVFSAVLAVFNIGIAFGTLANVGRYKIRNEEARLAYAQDKFPELKETVFSLMDRKAQDATSTANPFLRRLDARVSAFRADLKYYGYPESPEFRLGFFAVRGNANDIEQLLAFKKLLASKLLADTYHVNSYVQESLVRIYKTVDDYQQQLVTASADNVSASNTSAARSLFNRLLQFDKRLDASLQKGPVRWGFVKQRKLAHWDIVVCLRYFASWFVCLGRNKTSNFVPIETETRAVLDQTRQLSVAHSSKVLRREIRDLETVLWATRESDIASMISVAVLIAFLASIVFTVSRIFDIKKLEMLAFWALSASALGAMLATSHLIRKLVILVKLWSTLGKKLKSFRSDHSTPTRVNKQLHQVRSVVTTQIALTIARLVSAATAAVALPFAVAEQGFPDAIGTPPNLPFYIALISVCVAFGATIFFFVVEFYVRYSLSTTLGHDVCECFRDEIESMHEVLVVDANDIDSRERQAADAWDYTAREFVHKYRFDTVFAADRFGQIVRYIQAGMDPRHNFI